MVNASSSVANASSACPAAAAASAFSSVHVTPCAPEGRCVAPSASSASAGLPSAMSSFARTIACCWSTRCDHVRFDGNAFAISRASASASAGVVNWAYRSYIADDE